MLILPLLLLTIGANGEPKPKPRAKPKAAGRKSLNVWPITLKKVTQQILHPFPHTFIETDEYYYSEYGEYNYKDNGEYYYDESNYETDLDGERILP